MITIAPQFTQIEHRWEAWKAMQSRKTLVLQSYKDESTVTIWGYDGPDAHLCCLYRGAVPACVIASGYTQEQNDADLADYETNYASTANGPNVTAVGGEFTPKTIKNEHNLEPWGAEKGQLVPSEYCCPIVLSEKSTDGLTFKYDENTRLVPVVGQYIFQNNNCTRSWITAHDAAARTVTFDLPVLDNGPGFYRKGYPIFCKIRDYKPLMYLWGIYFKVLNAHDDDFIELNVIDKDNKFEDDEFCMRNFGIPAAVAVGVPAMYGFEKLGEFSEWCKYYDESWVINMNGREVKTPDGSPGVLLPNLYLLIMYYPAATDDNPVKIFHDYLPTSKS